MRIHILLENGCHYISKDNPDITSIEALDMLKDNIGDLTYLHTILEDGSHLLLGPEALKKAHFILKDS